MRWELGATCGSSPVPVRSRSAQPFLRASGERIAGRRTTWSKKYDLGGLAPTFEEGELPWGYGDNRITVLVRSPDSLYAYWEITDEGIADARGRLGTAGQSAWCALRVYDTTGRDFDGTNANTYFYIRVERTDREHFLTLNKPGSTFHVEIGMQSHECYFQPIARSGRADLPRKSPSPIDRWSG